MRDFSGTIRAFQGTLSGFRFELPESYPEDFAQKRYLKKMEVPDSRTKEVRRSRCWDDWLSFDLSLPRNVLLPSSEWYKAREIVFTILRDLPSRDFYAFPKGSEVYTTKGCNSLEARLCKSRWSVTHDALDEFCRMSYGHTGLKRATKRRYHRLHRGSSRSSLRAESRREWGASFFEDDPAFSIFSRRFEQICTLERGSRFSTVPKNNERDRPINIEPLGNIIVQRSIGEKIRKALKTSLSIDLDVLSDVHRRRIRDCSVATIDLKDASDSVSLALCKFLLPEWFFGMISAARSQMVLGLDGSYHLTRKVSSMGNGFTFELMTLILTSLCRVLDPKSSVFGDDIIIDKSVAPRLIELLEEVGFVVNQDKSFISGPFRESCGANFHEEYGYLESFDFRYPETIHDCIVSYNKAAVLALKFNSFRKLRDTLHKHVPKALQGGPLSCLSLEDIRSDNTYTVADPRPLSGYFQTGGERPLTPKFRKIEKTVAAKLQYPASSVRAHLGFRYVPSLRTKTLRHLDPNRHWAKLLAYLYAGRRSNDEISGDGRWATCVYLSIDGKTSRASQFSLID